MKVTPDGFIVDAERELEDIGEEIAALEEQLARKKERHALLRSRGSELSNEQRARTIRRTMSKCRAALESGRLSLEGFAGIASMARGLRMSPASAFGKSTTATHPIMPLNQATTVHNLRANGLGALVGDDGQWR